MNHVKYVNHNLKQFFNKKNQKNEVDELKQGGVESVVLKCKIVIRIGTRDGPNFN